MNPRVRFLAFPIAILSIVPLSRAAAAAQVRNPAGAIG